MTELEDLEDWIRESGPSVRPTFYHRDGMPIIDNELFPASLQWALLFEQTQDRIVGQTRTLYGEKLSTVWLGTDHSFRYGRPLLFETMLFGPQTDEQRQRSRDRLREMAEACRESRINGEDMELPEEGEDAKREEEQFKRRFPHDQLQLRYTTENEAIDSHELLKAQCLIPPRWRHFLLWTIGRQEAWRNYDDEEY